MSNRGVKITHNMSKDGDILWFFVTNVLKKNMMNVWAKLVFSTVIVNFVKNKWHENVSFLELEFD